MKLLKIVANNFKLCENNFTISFVPEGNKTKEDKEFELSKLNENLYVFNTLGIIGNNASGKTTATDLLSLVYDIFSNFRVKNMIYIFKYFDKPINLDICFYHDGYLYRYITKLLINNSYINNNSIIFKEQKLFKRKYKKTYSKNLFDFEKYEEVKINAELPEDTSILYNLFKTIKDRGIYYKGNETVDYFFDNFMNVYKFLNNDLNIVESILKMFDEHLESIKTTENGNFIIYYTSKTQKEVSSEGIYEVLSSGTIKGLSLFSYVVYSLKNGCDLVIDEIENHFHKMLVENLVNLYKDKSVNKSGATLIFTTHYCELLDLFNRTDNIYITKYNNKISLENMYTNYKFRPELSKSNKFYSNAFNTDVNYETLMNFKKELM